MPVSCVQLNSVKRKEEEKIKQEFDYDCHPYSFPLGATKLRIVWILNEKDTTSRSALSLHEFQCASVHMANKHSN